MSSERRIHPRTDTRVRSTIRCGDATVEGIVENIGAGGVFFSTGDLETTLDIGVAVTLTLHLDAGPREVTGSVLRSDRYFDGADVRRSFALKFDAEIEMASLGLGA